MQRWQRQCGRRRRQASPRGRRSSALLAFALAAALAAGPAFSQPKKKQGREEPRAPQAAAAEAAAQDTGEAAAQGTGQDAPLPNTWYAQALAYAETGINVTHFWSKDARLRAETVIAGRRIVTIVDDDTYYAYDGLGMAGVAIGRAPEAMRLAHEGVRPFGNEIDAVLRQGGEGVAVENLGGREVEVFRVTDAAGRRQVWATRGELRLPLRVEIFQRQRGTTLRTDFLYWQRGLPIPDAFFRPEAGIELARLSYEQYVALQAERRPVGPVPVLYYDLLHGIREGE
jgi:hypothetical protein